MFIKKLLAFIICLIMGVSCLFGAVACNHQPQENVPPINDDNKENTDITVEDILAQLTDAQLSCDSYDRVKYMLPIWQSYVIYNETALFVQNEDGTFPIVNLAFPIAKLLEVRSSNLVDKYVEGKDYQVKDGGIQLLEGTSINYLKYNEYVFDAEQNKVDTYKSLQYGGKHVLTSPELYVQSTCITYIRTSDYDGPAIQSNADKLPKTMQKLNSKQRLNIVFYGDSITYGACTSGWIINKQPYTPIYSDLVVTELKEYFNYSNIHSYNTAVGGWQVKDGIDNMQERLLDKNPDLVVLAFGMNDAHNGSFSVDKYQSEIEIIMKNVLEKNANCEFLLVAPMLSNPDRDIPYKNQAQCKIALQNLADKYQGCGIADLTVMCQWLLQRKEYKDFTDNLVHPTDFFSRVYAQVIVSSMIEDYYDFLLEVNY